MAKDVAHERYETAFRLREEGLTFREIGQALGIAASRASQLHAQALKHKAKVARWSEESPTPETSIERLNLSDRTYKALASAGFKALSELMPLDADLRRRLIALPHFGRSQLIELQSLIDGL